MTQANPFASPNQPSGTASSRQSRLHRLLVLFVSTCAGIVAGSYVSAELLYFHFNDETRSMDDVFSHTIEAVLSSPLSMSFGVFPTIGSYGPHGFLVIPGALMAIIGAFLYFRDGKTAALFVVLAGFVLWSHNNYLGISALMSV